MAKLLGFQFADMKGNNIQGDDNDPVGLASFEVMDPLCAIDAVIQLESTRRYLLMPIFEGDIEEPQIITKVFVTKNRN